MVKSGLTERTSVSHIRLAIHLIAAFITFGFTLYFAFELLQKKIQGEYDQKLNRLTKLIFGIVTIQIIYGAFVAGLHAGKIYNTFPLMNGMIVPDGLFNMNPWWINFFDNLGTVQFMHRFFAYVIVALSITLWMNVGKSNSDSIKRRGIHFLVAAISIQFVLGILTLLTGVNLMLAVLHQAGAFFVFGTCVYLIFVFRKNPVLIQ
jgi:cytochrome c oxidase assembly protein subunit 15